MGIISGLLLYCLLQTSGLMLILLRKKFKTAPNMILNYILFTLVVHFSYGFVLESGYDITSLASAILCFEFTAPISVYFYAYTVIKGKLPSFKHIARHLIIPAVLFIALAITDLMGYDSFHQWVHAMGMVLLIILSISYPLVVIYRLSKFYHLESFGRFNIFKYNKDKTVMLRLVVFMMLLNGILMIPQTIIESTYQSYSGVMEIAHILYFITLSYLFAYHIITNPQAIHHKNKKYALHNYDKYLRSGLQEKDAKAIANRLNNLFSQEKPFLDQDIKLSIISEKLDIPPHHITETLNGLVGQNFNEYVNNYRVEEFKALLKESKYENYSILALAFEVGFKSKGTFNTAFKKFTNQTPSAYRNSLLKQED